MSKTTKLHSILSVISLIQFSLVAQSCPTLCNPMDCRTPGFPALHYLLEFSQTHVHWVNDAIQPSYPLSSPSPPALNLLQHEGFSSELALCIRWPKYWSFSFSISPSSEYSRVDFLSNWLVWSPGSPRDPQESSPAPQIESINSLALNLL